LTKEVYNLQQATAKIEIENEFCIVTRWTFPPQTATGWHRHEKDYVVMPTVSGELTIVHSDGSEVKTEMVAGKPYSRSVGVEHDVQNRSASMVEFLEVEIIQKATL
jgi:quercetin dioxygenase-like cupin family protein